MEAVVSRSQSNKLLLEQGTERESFLPCWISLSVVKPSLLEETQILLWCLSAKIRAALLQDDLPAGF